MNAADIGKNIGEQDCKLMLTKRVERHIGRIDEWLQNLFKGF